MSHTPGSWAVWGDMDDITKEWTVYQPIANENTTKGQYIALVDGKDNATLIASAPDLLEALEIVLEDYEVAAAEWIGDAYANAYLRISKAKAAIAQARGKV